MKIRKKHAADARKEVGDMRMESKGDAPASVNAVCSLCPLFGAVGTVRQGGGGKPLCGPCVACVGKEPADILPGRTQEPV